MNYLTVGVLGHVDHGKTALVRALTGIETDRLKEERERGISIALGFADLELPEGRIAFVDAPGHERFVRTMVSGATGISAVLLVVDANEGVRQQTREHFDIAQILGIPCGLVAMTKCDAATPDRIEQSMAEVDALLSGTFLATAPRIRTSAVSGQGLDELRSALGTLVSVETAVHDEGLAYLPVDRVFTMSGFGTVVTGTLRRGALAEGDEVQLYPSDERARVRKIESHGHAVTRGLPGRRTAVNLRGIEKSELRRGYVVATPGSIRPSPIVDVQLSLLPSAARALRARDSVRLLFGTAEVVVRARLLDREELAPGDACVAQFESETALPFLVREKFILRTESPVTTIGGGTFLGSSEHRRKRTPETLSVLSTLAKHDLANTLQLRLGETEPEPLDLDAFARDHRFRPDRVQNAAREMKLVAVDGGVVRPELANRFTKQTPETPALNKADASTAAEIEAAFRVGGLEPPAIADVVGPDRNRNRIYRHLVDSGVLVPLYAQTKPKTLANTIVFHRDSIEDAKHRLTDRLAAQNGFQTQDAKATLGLSRKFLIPLLEHFDTQRFTRRRGELREFVNPRDNA